MKKMKKLVAGLMLGVTVLSSPVSSFIGVDDMQKVEAACADKTPTIRKSGKWAEIETHYKLSVVYVDGKAVKIHSDKCSNPNHSGSCQLDTFNLECNGHDLRYVKLSSGTHNIVALDNYGHYSVKNITID